MNLIEEGGDLLRLIDHDLTIRFGRIRSDGGSFLMLARKKATRSR